MKRPEDDWTYGTVLALPSGVTVMCLGISRGAVTEDGYVAAPGTWIGLTLAADAEEIGQWPVDRTCSIVAGEAWPVGELWEAVE